MIMQRTVGILNDADCTCIPLHVRRLSDCAIHGQPLERPPIRSGVLGYGGERQRHDCGSDCRFLLVLFQRRGYHLGLLRVGTVHGFGLAAEGLLGEAFGVFDYRASGGVPNRWVFCNGGIERLWVGGVKTSMELVRTVICSVLPAVWLLAAGHCLADSVSGCPDGCGRPLVSAREGSKHAPLKDLRSFEQPARLLNRRAGMQPGWGGLLVPVAVSALGLGELEQASARLTVSTDALGLAQCWQFYWRTAAEPRAPSSVS
jgi:hypothetical protein